MRPRHRREAKEDEEKAGEGEAKSNHEEVRYDEIAEGGGGALTRLPDLFGCGFAGGGGGEERLRPSACATTGGEGHGGDRDPSNSSEFGGFFGRQL